MSFSSPGQQGGYTPPPPSLNPPTRKSTSPWLYVSLGCGFLTLLMFGGCVGGIMYLRNTGKQIMAQPIVEADIKKELGDVPIYPGATLDKEMTRVMRVAKIALRLTFSAKDDGTAVAYRTPDSYLKVMSWYDEKLRAAGYKAGQSQGGMFCFQKGTAVVTLQASAGAGSKGESEPAFTLMKFQDAKIPGTKQSASGGTNN